MEALMAGEMDIGLVPYPAIGGPQDTGRRDDMDGIGAPDTGRDKKRNRATFLTSWTDPYHKLCL